METPILAAADAGGGAGADPLAGPGFAGRETPVPRKVARAFHASLLARTG
jgi:hypothetical protein